MADQHTLESVSPTDTSWPSTMPAGDARHPSLSEAELDCLRRKQRLEKRHDSKQEAVNEISLSTDHTGDQGVIIREYPAEDLDLTYEKLLADFRETFLLWEQSACRRYLRNLLRHIIEDKGIGYCGAICVGLGSLSRTARDRTRRSMLHLVAFLDIARYLKEVTVQPPGVHFVTVFQEKHSVFTAMDLKFLRSIGVVPYIAQWGEPLGGQFVQDQLRGHGAQFVFEAFVARDDGFYLPLFDVNPPLLVSTMLFDHIFVDWCRRQPLPAGQLDGTVDEAKMNTLLGFYEHTIRISGSVSSNPARPAQDLYSFYRLSKPESEKVAGEFFGMCLLWKC